MTREVKAQRGGVSIKKEFTTEDTEFHREFQEGMTTRIFSLCSLRPLWFKSFGNESRFEVDKSLPAADTVLLPGAREVGWSAAFSRVGCVGKQVQRK